MKIRIGLVLGAIAIVSGCDCQSAVRIGPSKTDGGLDGGGSGGGGGNNGNDSGTGGGGGGDPVFSSDGGCGLVTCQSAAAECGLLGDGCGAVIDCGSCPAPQTCGGGGVPSHCGGTMGCVPRTCADVSATCGPISDGCGSLIQCGTCPAPETCGGDGTHNKCGLSVSAGGDGGGGVCVPQTCLGAGAECGVIGDGCGNIAMCPACTGSGQTCGGGGVPYRCGGGTTCVPRACPPGACGAYGDGCGNILSCTTVCNAPQTCGGATVANQCGGGTACVPRTLADAFPDGGGCGFVGDGCGGLLDAGVDTCVLPAQCGAGGVPNQCGGSVPCVARTCADYGATCGFVGDGCGNIVSCGGCDAGICGGNGVANVCGSRPPCQPKTCMELGKTCGQVGDGCGGLTVDCGTCTAPDICGGAGIPSVCGSIIPDAGAGCTNLCLKQTCAATKLTGKVLAPTDSSKGFGTPDPIPNALVYVPNGTVLPFSDAGVTCDKCSDGVTGSPLISTLSNVDGTFTLENVPCGVDVPVVFQLGKWRRQVTVSSVQCCMTTAMPATQTRFPRRQAEFHPNDNIPLIAVVTGSADDIENVFPKIGIDPIAPNSQYSSGTGTGRVRFYRDNGYDFGSTPDAGLLTGDLNELKKYDMVILDCVGSERLKSPAARANVEAYANAGGRVFASHYSYVWMFPNAIDPGGGSINSPISFTPTATWNVGQNEPDNLDAYLDISFPKGVTFAQWVQLVNAQASTSTPAHPRIRVVNVRHDIDAVVPPGQQWVYRADDCTRISCSNYSCGRNIPDGCGNTRNCGNNGGRCFNGNTCGGGGTPGVCGNGGTCVPFTCAQLNFNCGVVSNGCGGTLDCGGCTAPNICGGGGVGGRCGVNPTPLQYTFNTPTAAAPAAQCGRVLFSDFHVASGGYFSGQAAAPMTAQEKVFEYLIYDLSSCIQPDVTPPQMCTERSCADQGLNCGAAANGCGGTIASCGMCTNGATCGGGGTPGVCGTACTKRSCTELGFNCGQQTDGCGGQQPCGSCTMPQTCGGGGSAGVCGGGACIPRTCVGQGFSCGQQSDGCGGILDCGTCTAPQTCGGSSDGGVGAPGVCGGGSTCVKKTCTELGLSCGLQTDGCGGSQDCGMCTAPQTCGGGGLPGVCGGGGMCVPKTCADQGYDCGLQGDGCGGQISCGTCATSETCGVVVPGMCGSASCNPLTCAAQGLACGPAGDGCGNMISCGTCTAPDTCGGAGTRGQCGHTNCVPRTCQQAGANCGAIADGCGGAVQCGTCTGSDTCGGSGSPNVCGVIN